MLEDWISRHKLINYFIVAICIATIIGFHNIIDRFGIGWYFALSYIEVVAVFLNVSVFVLIGLRRRKYIRNELCVNSIYRDVGPEFVFPRGWINKRPDEYFLVGSILAFLALPYLVYRSLYGQDVIHFFPVQISIVICAYIQTRLVFEFIINMYSKVEGK